MTRTLVNVRSLRCPLPLLKLKQALAAVEIGDEVAVEATDVGSWRDIPAFVDLTDHELTEQKNESGVYFYVVRKGE
jgi:tRNA 2-thiouridine synthesizing protein A